MKNLRYPDDFPDYDARALHEYTYTYAPDMEELCDAYFLPTAGRQGASLLAQLVWPFENQSGGYDAQEYPVVRYVHAVVNQSKSDEVVRGLKKEYGRVTPVGKTRAFGYTMGMHHFCQNDVKKLDNMVSGINPSNKKIVQNFLSNSFETCQQGKRFVNGMRGYKHVWNVLEDPTYNDPAYVGRCLTDLDAYRGLQQHYFDWLNVCPAHIYRDVVADMVGRFTNVLKKSPTKEKLDMKYDLFLKNELYLPDVYHAELRKTANTNSLLTNVDY